MSIVTTDERKIVSVLFCDIAGSYTYLYDADPEQGKQIIDEAISTMTRVIENYGGIVNQVQGDGVMSLYGAPTAVEDHAKKACEAATELVDTFKRKNANGAWVNGVSIDIRVGVSTGEAVVGVQATKFPAASENYEYFATGAVSHLAGRLQKLAESFEIVISANTVELLGKLAVTKLISNREVHELIGVHAKPSVLVRLNSNKPLDTLSTRLPFVGRENELAALRQTFSSSLENNEPAFILVSGDAGIGKSRLIQEFLSGEAQDDWLVVVAAATEIERNSPFAVFRRILGSWLEGLACVTPAQQLAKLAAVSEQVDGDDWVLPLALANVLGLQVLDERWDRFEPDIKRSQIFKSILKLLKHWGEQAPLVCLIEDIHWADPVSLRLLESVTQTIGSGSLVILCSSRDQHKVSYTNTVQGIHLDSLNNLDARTLFRSLEISEKLLEDDINRLLDRCGGVPLFIEHMAYSDTRGNSADNHRSSSVNFQFSSTVRSLIDARLDQLPIDAKRLLSIASVAGTHFNLNALKEISERHPAETRKLLDTLIVSGLIKATRGSEEFAFTHALYQEVAYLGMLKSRLLEYHCKYLDFFKRMQDSYPEDRFSEHIEYHAFRGKRWADVTHYGGLAAREALERGAYREAMHYLEEAVYAFPKMTDYAAPKDMGLMRQHAVCLLDLSRAVIPVGEIGRSYDALEDCRALCEQLNDDHILCEILAYRTALYAIQEDADTAIACGFDAVKSASKTGSNRLIYGCTVYLAEATFFAGDFPSVVSLLQPIVDQGMIDRFPLDRIGNIAPASIDCYGILGMAYAQMGEFDLAEHYGELAKGIADDTGESFDQGLAYFYLTYILVHRLKMDEAEQCLQTVEEIINAGGVQFLRPWVHGLLGYIYANQGRLGDARTLVDQSLADARSMSLRIFECYALVSMVFVLEQMGELTQAQSALDQAELLAQEGRFKSVSMWVIRSKGFLAMANGNFSQAVEHFTEAREQAETLKMWPDVARCHSLTADAIEKIVQNKQVIEHNPETLDLKKQCLHHRNLAQQLYLRMGMK